MCRSGVASLVQRSHTLLLQDNNTRMQYGASSFGGRRRRGSAAASGNTSSSGGDGVSAIYAAASGMFPPPSVRKVRKAAMALRVWHLHRMWARLMRQLTTFVDVLTRLADSRDGWKARAPQCPVACEPRARGAISGKLVASAARQVRSVGRVKVSKSCEGCVTDLLSFAYLLLLVVLERATRCRSCSRACLSATERSHWEVRGCLEASTR